MADRFDDMRKEAARLLQLIPNDQPHGTELFNALARHTFGVSVEAVLLREGRRRSTLEVYMTKRTADEAYANEWHVPGSFVRNGEWLDNVLCRLSEGKEYGVKIESAQFVGDRFSPEKRFRSMLDRVYLIDAAGEPNNPRGTWFSVNKLPEKTVESHRDFIIPLAAKARKIG